MIRDVELADAEAITKIYNHYVERTVITFEMDLVNLNEMQRRIQNILAAGFPWLVKQGAAGEVVGYAYVGSWRARAAYRASVESAVYVSCDQTGKGVGRELYEALLDRLQESGNVHVVVGVITVPNDASIGLHRKLGFEEVGIYREVGRKFERWIDVQTMQLKMSEWRGGR